MISDKYNQKRFKKFKNSGRKYSQFVNRVKFIFNITNEYDFIFEDLQEIKDYSQLQLHHIDSNSSNNSAFNLVVLPKYLHKCYDELNEKEFWSSMKFYGLSETILAKQRKLIGVI